MAMPRFTSIGKVQVDNSDATAGPRWAVGDFNADGRQDIAFWLTPTTAFSPTNPGTSVVHFFTQTATGALVDATAQLTPDPTRLINVAKIGTADFNSDGTADLFIGSSGHDPYIDGKPPVGGVITIPGDKAWTYLSSPTGFHSTSAAQAENRFLHGIAIADINNDGKQDAFALSLNDKSYLMVNDGNGNLAVDYTHLPTGALNPSSMDSVLSTYENGSPKELTHYSFTSSAFVDANRDGAPDLLLMPAAAPNGVLYLNDGHGDFSKSAPVKVSADVGYGPGLETRAPDGFTKVGAIFLDNVVFDVNGDGFDDVISIATEENWTPSKFVYYQGTRLHVLINDGASFRDESSTRILSFSQDPGINYSHYDSITAFDINGDGCKDLLLDTVTTNWSGAPSYPSTRFLLNNGKGAFTDVTSEMNLPQGTYIPFVIDGKVALANTSSTPVSMDTVRNVANYVLNFETLVSDVPATFVMNNLGGSLLGSSRNDMLYTGKGSDVVRGGAGVDTAVYAGSRSSYAITKGASGTTIAPKTVSEGTDTLFDVERIKFSDGGVALDISGNAGQAYRLYQAAFDRVPDKGGLGFQMNALDTGFSLQQIAQNFIDSPEFLTKYGTGLSNGAFVSQLYANVLHRAPDPGGYAYQLKALEDGMSRSQLLINFSESAENYNATLVGIQEGIEYTPVA